VETSRPEAAGGAARPVPAEAEAPAAAEAAPGAEAGTDPEPAALARPAPSPRELAAARARRRARAALRAAPDPEPRSAPGTQPETQPETQPAPKPQPPQAEQPRATPQPARLRRRHWAGLASFALLVLLPFLATVAYLWIRAADQFHSEVAFSIRAEESGAAAAGLLGALTQMSGGSASDADILFEYIRSQKIVEEISRDLDLRAIWNRPGTGWRDGDPVFTLGTDPSIEALHATWNRMVEVGYDSNAGIIHVRANAFAPEEATAITTAILARSDTLVNALSDESRADAVRFAEGELAEAETNLRTVRGRLADFRRTHNMVDPAADVAGQSGLMSAL